jgi:NAD(P)-dependent dehydrogenase (short-subunit alcohol dehydrogenase family)
MSAGLWRYDGRRAVVTGCASGIGAEVARQLGELGAEVIGLDLRRPAGRVDTFHEVDLADTASIDAVVARLGRVDVLFNVAGVSSGIGDARRVVAINFLGTRHLSAALLPAMGPGSALVHVSSLAAAGYRDNAAVTRGLVATGSVADGLAWCDAHPDALADGGYRLSKEAIVLHTLATAATAAARGIRVNCTCPGVTETPILEDSRAALGQDALDRIPKPLGRVAEAAEQAAVLVFLGSPAAGYVNGEVIWADGGNVSGRHARELGVIPEA